MKIALIGATGFVGAAALEELMARGRNFGSAFAPGYLSLIFIRLLTGLPHGTYFGVAALTAASLSLANQRARAVGLVMLGLTSATPFGVPLAAWLGQRWGWRAAFAFVGVIAALAWCQCAAEQRMSRRLTEQVPCAN